MKRYPHYKHYKPRPPQSQLDAHHNFMELIKEPVKMITTIELTETETDTLLRVVASKLETKNSELCHANAYATELQDPDHAPLLRIWEKLNET